MKGKGRQGCKVGRRNPVLGPRRTIRHFEVALLVGLEVLGLGGPVLAAAPDSSIIPLAAQAGRNLYREGILASGAPLQGLRQAGTPGDGLVTKGADAACVNCHLRSGLGSISTDRRVSIPPITGQYLFAPRRMKAERHGLPSLENMKAGRTPYTEETLARALREGVDSDGRPLGTLMPRFALGDADMAALSAYLKTLDPEQVPGVTESVLHFATIITPDADPVKRRGMLDVLERYFADRNALPAGPAPEPSASAEGGHGTRLSMTRRRWQLHVWELTGPPQTWQAQLDGDLAREPVMAVISGLGGSNWAPVHAFCEAQSLPCLFPNVEVPVVAGRDFYSLYFSKGVLLEAGLIARSITDPEAAPVRAVRQVYRRGDSGESAAQALVAALAGRGIALRSIALEATGGLGEGVAEDLRKAQDAEALVLWLRPSDLAALGAPPAAAVDVYVSGLMGGLERAPLPPAWRSRTRMAYPFDLPDARVVRVDYPLGWFSFRHIRVVAEQVQVDTFLACAMLAEALGHSADTVVREFLVERMEEMLEHRFLTGYYPRLTLAEGQGFASKGGYVVRFAQDQGRRLVVARDWTVP